MKVLNKDNGFQTKLGENQHRHCIFCKYNHVSMNKILLLLATVCFCIIQTTSLPKLYYSLVHTYLTYALSLWASTHKTYLLKL